MTGLQRERRSNARPGIPVEFQKHPFIVRLQRLMTLNESDIDKLWQLIEADITVKKRRDLVVDGYEYRKLCFVEGGFAARYKLLRNGKRQIVNFVLPGDLVGLPGSFLEKARYSVIAVTDLKLQVCSMGRYAELCYDEPKFALVLSWLAVHEAIICAEHAISTGRRTPIEYCLSRYRSYDPATDTFMGYDGLRHPCIGPY